MKYAGLFLGAALIVGSSQAAQLTVAELSNVGIYHNPTSPSSDSPPLWQHIAVGVEQVVMARDPIDGELSLYAVQESDGDIYKYLNRINCRCYYMIILVITIWL